MIWIKIFENQRKSTFFGQNAKGVPFADFQRISPDNYLFSVVYIIYCLQKTTYTPVRLAANCCLALSAAANASNQTFPIDKLNN